MCCALAKTRESTNSTKEINKHLWHLAANCCHLQVWTERERSHLTHGFHRPDLGNPPWWLGVFSTECPVWTQCSHAYIFGYCSPITYNTTAAAPSSIECGNPVSSLSRRHKGPPPKNAESATPGTSKNSHYEGMELLASARGKQTLQETTTAKVDRITIPSSSTSLSFQPYRFH